MTQIMALFTKEVSSSEQTFQEKELEGPTLPRGCQFPVVGIKKDEVLCKGGTGCFSVPREKVWLFQTNFSLLTS